MTRLEDIPSWRLRQILDGDASTNEKRDFMEDVIRFELERRMKTK